MVGPRGGEKFQGAIGRKSYPMRTKYRRGTVQSSNCTGRIKAKGFNNIDERRQLRLVKLLNVDTKKPIMPIPMGTVPRIGTTQCVCLSADHPYQNMPMATRGVKNIMTLIRYSGLRTPPFLLVKRSTRRSFVDPTMMRPKKNPIPEPR